MNVQEFQNKLKEVQEIARQHGNALNAAEIRHVFEECDLDKSQLLGVLKYLTSQGILIEGLETAGEELGKLMRRSDYLGKLQDNHLYALLANTDNKDAEYVIRRLEATGYQSRIWEET